MFSGPDNPKSFTSPTGIVKAVRHWQTSLTAALTILMITAVLSATAPAQTSPPTTNGFVSHQTVLAAGIYDFFNFLGFGSKQKDESESRKSRSISPAVERKPEQSDSTGFEKTFSPNAVACSATPGVTRSVPSTQYPTIQSAINAASTTRQDTIEIAASATPYTEQLVINKCVTLTGTGATQGDVIIKSPDTLTPSTTPGLSGTASVIEVRSQATVTIKNLTVQGPVPINSCGSLDTYGIFVVDSAALSMTDVTVDQIRSPNSDLYGCQNGNAIRAGSFSANQVGMLNFNRVTVSHYQKTGIIVSNEGSSATITNSTIEGEGAQTATGQNGIQVNSGATATITGNQIKGNVCDNAACSFDTYYSYGVIVFDSGNITISNNTFTNNDGGIFSDTTPLPTNAVPTPVTGTATISGNTFNQTRYAGIDVWEGNALISNNFINGGVFNANTNGPKIGVSVTSYTTNPPPGFDPSFSNTTATLTSNSITGTTRSGIELIDYDTDDLLTPSVTSAQFNRLANNAAGIVNNTTNTVPANNNFFGCNAGPGGGTGCDSISNNVTATNYLVLQAVASPTAVNTGATSTVTANLTHDNNGADTSASGMLPNGIPISFAATFGSVNPTSSTLTNGAATTTFTGDGPFSGNQTAVVTSTVDNANTPVSITVNDTTPPTVAIAVANGQPNPTSNLPINFTVTFRDAGTTTPVITGFDASDIDFSGTADTTGAIVTVTGGTNGVYNVEVNGFNGFIGNGTVIPFVKANAATDPAGNANAADSNKDASVNYISPDPRDCSTIASPYDVFTEFSIGSNPNCEYSYGYTTGSNPNSDFTLYTKRAAAATPGNPTTTRPRWYRFEADQFNVPGVFQDANALLLHPGSNGERSVVRFTVGDTSPTGGNVPAGFYKVTGGFSNGDNATTDVLVILRSGATSTTLFNGAINNPNGISSQPFDIPVTLAAGDSIDFSVGDGGNGYGSDSTLLSAKLTKVALTPETLYGLTPVTTTPVLTAGTESEVLPTATQNLVSFSSTNPNTIVTSVAITDVPSSEKLVGIDFRPRNGVLYAVSSDGSTGRVYTINVSTGAATAINGGTNTIRTAAATITLNGTNFGVDFNPMADRIRLVSDSGQNLRINPDTGVTVVDGTINPAGNTITAVAYTNNTFPAPTSTVLYDINASNNTLYTQTPPNNGTLEVVGSLGITASAVNGFDISGATGRPYASFVTNNTATTSDLYTIDLATGAASRVGKIGTAENSATGLSVSGLTVAPATIGTDATFPKVLSIAYGNPATSPTNAASVDFVVTFSEAVTGVDTTDFMLATGSISTAAITAVNPSTCPLTAPTGASCYTVSVSTGGGDGTVGLNLVDNDSIADASNNQLGGSGAGNGNFTGQVYTIDKTRPTVTVAASTGQTSPTTSPAISFTVDFSETVIGFDQGDLTVTNGTVTSFTDNGDTTYTVVVTAAASGTVSVSVGANVANDAATNGNTASNTASVTYFTTTAAMVVDDDGMAGFNADGSVNCEATTAAPNTIQSAVNLSNAGDTIRVCPGLYVEEVNINKQLTILGPKSTVNPNAGTPVVSPNNPTTEAIISPSVNDPSFSGTPLVTLGAEQITFSGFTLDGDNPNLSGGVLFNGVDVNAGIGIDTPGTDGNGLNNPRATVSNNIIKNIAELGMELLARNAANVDSSTVQNNRFDNIPGVTYGGGLYLGNNAYANVTGNVLTQVSLGIVIENFSAAGTAATPTISNNQITANRIGIRHNLHYSYTTNGYTISGNRITSYVESTDPTATRFSGIRVESINGTVPVTVSGNIINANRAGLGSIAANANVKSSDSVFYRKQGERHSTTQKVDGSESAAAVSGYTRIDGIFITNDSTISPNILITGNTISNALRGISHNTPAVPTVECNLLRNNDVGVYVGNDVQFGGTTSYATNGIIIRQNNLFNNTTFGVQSDTTGIQNPVVTDARNNFWGAGDGPSSDGTSTATGSGDKVSTNVTFTPFLTTLSSCAPSVPNLSIADAATVAEGNSGTKTVTFTVTLSNPNAGETVTVNYATEDGFATTADNDYVAKNGTLTFAPGTVTQTVSVTVNGDTKVEPDEAFLVRLSNATNAAIINDAGSVTITNDDFFGSLQFSNTTYSVTEGTPTASITVTRTGGSAQSVTANCSTVSGGTATPNVDYTVVTNQTITFADGDTASKTCSIPITNDNLNELAETVNLALTLPSGSNSGNNAALGSPNTAVLTINDDESNNTGQVVISGTITQNGNGLNGVTVNLSGTSSGTTTTANGGKYSFTVAGNATTPNNNYLVTPSAANLIFDPLSRSYVNVGMNVTNANFIAYTSPIPRNLRIVNANQATFGSTSVTVPVVLDSLGNENDLSFSLNYDSTKLSNPMVACGSDATGCTLTTNRTTAGLLGIQFERPNDPMGNPTVFTAGTGRQVVTVTFTVTPGQAFVSPSATPNAAFNTPVTFGDSPTTRDVNDADGNRLATNYFDGRVVFAQGYEGDLGVINQDGSSTHTGNGNLSTVDLTVLRAFVSGTQTPDPNFNEFQRADVADSGTKGGGTLTSADITVLRNYIRDSVLTPAGGPTQLMMGSIPNPLKEAMAKRSGVSADALAATGDVRLVNTAGRRNASVTVPITLDSNAMENGITFSLNYDQTKLKNPTVSIGSDVPLTGLNSNGDQSSALLTLNRTQVSTGKLGVSLALPEDNSFSSPGTKQVIRVTFDVDANAALGDTPVTFGDTPLPQELNNTNGAVLSSNFVAGAVNIQLGPTAASAVVGGRVTTAKGGSLGQTSVTLTDSSGRVRSTVTNSFGNFRFENVPAGASYVVTVNSKRYTFTPQVVNLNDNLTDLKFTAAP